MGLEENIEPIVCFAMVLRQHVNGNLLCMWDISCPLRDGFETTCEWELAMQRGLSCVEALLDAWSKRPRCATLMQFAWAYVMYTPLAHFGTIWYLFGKAKLLFGIKHVHIRASGVHLGYTFGTH